MAISHFSTRQRNPVSPRNRVSGEPSREELGIAPDARLIAYISRHLPYTAARDAVWAFDILKCLYDDLFLLMIGEGSAQQKLRKFARDIEVIDRVRFVGSPEPLHLWLKLADVAWILGGEENIGPLVFDARLVGLPVVATELPATAELIDPGFLVPRGDKPALARQTRLLLDSLHVPVAQI